jgi:hypothetical protein
MLPSDEQSVYYAMDIARASLTEIWRVAYPNPLAIAFVLVSKVLRRPVRGNVAIAYDSITFKELEDVPAHVVTRLEAICRECESLGFTQRFAHTLSVLGNGETHAITMTGPGSSVFAHVLYVRTGQIEERITAFSSYFDDGTVVTTTNGRRRLKTPPEMDVRYAVGSTVDQLLSDHHARVSQVTRASPRCLDDAALREAVLRNARLATRFHETRGLYVPLTNAELARLSIQPQHIAK